jgi:DNA-binding beta-propeller fold protein YncE
MGKKFTAKTQRTQRDSLNSLLKVLITFAPRFKSIKKMNRGLAFLVLLAGCALFLVADPGQAAEKKKGQPKKAQAPFLATPEIRRTAVFQDRDGERTLRSPIALVRDPKNGDLVITSFETSEVVIFDKSGALIKRMGREEGLVSPYGVAMDVKGRIYVSEVNTGFLKVFSPGGVLEDEIDLSKLTGKSVAPGRITLDKDDLIYIVDLNSQSIIVLNSKGDLVLSRGEFNYLQKAGAAGNDRFVGLSAYGTAVKVFSKAGALLNSFGAHGDELERNVSFPTGFAIDNKGRLWIADAFQHRLKVFSLDGKLLFNYGRLEEKAGGFFFPVDLCFGENGELFVLEKGANRLQVFQVGDLKQ